MRRHGSILMETVLAMPVLLLLIFMVLQFALIWTARQMTAYAAFCSTRALLVVPPAERATTAQNAAEVALAWVNMVGGNNDPVMIPGWGAVKGSDSSATRRVSVSFEVGSDTACATVSFKYPLLIPGMSINKIIANAAQGRTLSGTGTPNFYADQAELAANPTLIDGWPYLELKETCVLPLPYATTDFPTGAFEGVDIRSSK